MSNKNTGPSPFHKKGKNEGDSKHNFAGRTWNKLISSGNPFGGFQEGETYGEDEWGIAAGQAKVDKAFGEFGAIDTETNLFAGAKNLMNIGDNFSGMENTMEDLTVNKQAAEFQTQQGAQQRAGLLQGLKSSAGGSGVAGLAQAMANQGQLQNQQTSASIGQQESANQMAKAKGAADIQSMQRQGQQQTDLAMGQADMEAQKYQLQGAADARDLTLQQKQGELSFLAGQLGANQSNKDADTAGKSDRRLKKNITKIGESNRGFNIYSFEYKDSLDGEGLFQGVMSDEIPQEAVTSVDGYDRVNYGMLDVEFKQI